MINSTDEQMRNFEKIMLVMIYFFLLLNRYQPETDVSLSAVQVWETKRTELLPFLDYCHVKCSSTSI